jgi:hypothetical protein
MVGCSAAALTEPSPSHPRNHKRDRNTGRATFADQSIALNVQPPNAVEYPM